MKTKLSLIILFSTIFISSALADIACLKVTIKDGKPKLRVKTVQTATCPKGFKAVVDTSTLVGPQGEPGSDASINGVPAGGALSGTFPNPLLADESVGINNFTTLPGAKVVRTSSTSFTNSSASTIDFNSESYDNLGFYPGSGESLTIPVSGLYFIKGQINFVLNSNGSRLTTILKNGGVLFETAWDASDVSATFASTTGIEPLVAGDTLRLRGGQNSGVNLNTANSGGGHAILQVQWLSPLPE